VVFARKRKREQLMSQTTSVIPPYVGMRVQNITSIDRFPHFRLDSVGLTGIVTVVEEENLILVKMDEPIAGCEPWDNEIEVSRDELSEEHGSLTDLFYSYFEETAQDRSQVRGPTGSS
jgi:hypothetical protein